MPTGTGDKDAGSGKTRIYRLLRRSLFVVGLLGGLCTIGTAGCDAFNPAFVSLLDPTGESGFPAVSNAPGHVVVAVVNNAGIDERLLNFLAGRMNLTDAERQALRPRMRMRVNVTFTDGSTQTIEFITGSRNLIDPAFSAQSVPDLNQNDLDNAVVVCDVARVEVDPNTAIEVFIPVQLTEYELIESEETGGVVLRRFEQRAKIVPQFRALAIDDVDADGNVILQRNVGVRDVPSPATDLDRLCGAVVAIVIDGVLSVPFFDGVDDTPSYDRDDEPTVARIGGRYEFRVSIQ